MKIWAPRSQACGHKYFGESATKRHSAATKSFSDDMASMSYSTIAEQFIAIQGDEAGERLAAAIRVLREAGDEKGAKMLMKIARCVDELHEAESRSPRISVVRLSRH